MNSESKLNEYSKIYNAKIKQPTGSIDTFKTAVEASIESFRNDNKLLSRVDQGFLKLEDYHKLLTSLFHQVQYSSTSFALAGSQLDSNFLVAKDYLLYHAEEEKNHWVWIIQDLENSNYSGPDPRSLFPTVHAQAYLSFGVFLALKYPIARLAMASVLEGISGALGLSYSRKIVKLLDLKSNQINFFTAHGELDQGHSLDIIRVLEKCALTPHDWAFMSHVCQCTSDLYKAIYNNIVT